MLTMTFDQIKKAMETAARAPHMEIGINQMQLAREGEGRLKEDSTVSISPLAEIDMTGKITLYSWVVLTTGVKLFTHEHIHDTALPMIIAEERDPKKFIKVYDKTIYKDVWIYNDAVVLAKCTSIAQGVIVAARSVVTKSVEEPYSVWAGVPAILVSWRKCALCGAKIVIGKDGHGTCMNVHEEPSSV